MTLSHETVLELMSLADDELEGDEKERVEKLVASSDEAARIVAAMRRGEVGAWLGTSMDERAERAGADGIAGAVMAAVGHPSAAAQASKAGRPAEAGGVASIAGRARRSGLQIAVSAAAAGLALAAAVALYVRAGGDRTADHAPVASVGIPPVDFQPPSASVARVEPVAGGVEVNEIDAPSRGVSVFEIPVGAAAAVASPPGPSSVVVWVDDDPGSK
jgi:hypothetical protein